ncbi:MAG: hypothetical protein ACYC0H_21835, partial [Solirubrobacteraceae bacterium]
MTAERPSFALIDATAEPPEHGGSRYTASLANAPLLCHVLDELAGVGVQRARIVAPQESLTAMQAVLGRHGTSGIELSYVDSTSNGGRRGVVLAELDAALAREPVFLHPGDCLLREQLPRMQDRYATGDVDLVVPEQASTGSARAPAGDRLSDAVLLLGPTARAICSALLARPDAHDDLVESLLHSDCRLAVCEQSEHWSYDDGTAALLAGNRLLLDALPETPADIAVDESSQIHGRVAIDPGARVSNSNLHGPLAIGVGAIVEDSFIGPYTAIAPGAILSGVEIDNSMVLEGAEISLPGMRIEASIVGERARLTRSFELPRGLHV